MTINGSAAAVPGAGHIFWSKVRVVKDRISSQREAECLSNGKFSRHSGWNGYSASFRGFGRSPPENSSILMISARTSSP